MTVAYRDTDVSYRDLRYTYRGASPSDYPTVKVEVAFANNPTDTSLTWTDISAYVEEIRTRRGRQHELDRFEAGTATILLRNSDRRFDPTYTAGPYYGQLIPMKRIRVTARWYGTVYPVFSGLVEAWPQEYSNGGFSSYVPLPCTDLFKALALNGLHGSYPEELTGARIDGVLDEVGWPSAERDIDTGQSTVQAQVFEGSSALNHLQDVNVSENGFLFITRDGKVRFIDRHQLILEPLDTDLTWGDEDPEFPYTGITLDYGDSNLWNQVTVSADGLDTQVGNVGYSQIKYFVRTLNRSSVLSSEVQMQDLADFLASRFAEPAVRVASMTMDGLPTETFTQILAREIGDKVRVNRRPQGVGAVISQDSVIDGISVRVSQQQGWEMTWNLSPVDSVSSYWVLGDASQSLLGSTTKLSY
jgi:hypothetical protein